MLLVTHLQTICERITDEENEHRRAELPESRTGESRTGKACGEAQYFRRRHASDHLIQRVCCVKNQNEGQSVILANFLTSVILETRLEIKNSSQP